MQNGATMSWNSRRLDRPKRRRDWSLVPIIAGIVLVIALLAFIGSLYVQTRHVEVGCLVDSKDRGVSISTDSDGNTTSSTSYRIYTSCGVFAVEDALAFGKFNSADTYGSISEGKTYNLDVVGWRNGFFSWFPNVLNAKEAS